MNKLISVIIPVYNVEQYLRQCLDSVTNQTYKNLEIILVDDGSTDNSGKICDEYALKDSRIKVIHKQNGGVSSARNTGLGIATGDYIGFVDSDDYIEKDMYEYLYSLIVKYNVDISICQVDYIKGNNTSYKVLLKEDQLLTTNQALEIFYTQLYIYNKLFKKNILSNVFFTNDICIAEDTLFCLESFKKSKAIIYGKRIKYHYVYNLSSITKKNFYVEKLTYFKTINLFIDYAKENNLKYLYKKLKEQEVYHAIGFLKQIVECDFNDKNVIKTLQNKTRKNILLHLFSKNKMLNKLFAICVCINFKLARHIYKIISC